MKTCKSYPIDALVLARAVNSAQIDWQAKKTLAEELADSFSMTYNAFPREHFIQECLLGAVYTEHYERGF